jgi:glyoxylase-like metal-dependent hydrolase (beta-lactamase superfamily II)
MSSERGTRLIARRQVLRGGALFAGGAFLLPDWPAWAFQTAPIQDQLTIRRTQLAASPIERVTLTDTLTMLSGPGGNVVVLNGRDGKVVVDSFVQPAWGKLKAALDGMGTAPIKVLIDTHWHFDHADNNASFRRAGAVIVAHENTRKRLTETHDILGMHFEPAPADALPTETIRDARTIDVSGEQVALGYIPPAHTDTDLYIRFVKGNVLHLGDVFFNGGYPFLDASTGGNINGMIAGADLGLKLSDSTTKIVPGHGPLANKTALTACRDMLVTIRDRVETQKKSGKTLEEVVAAKPSAEFDGTWGKGFVAPDSFVALVYNTLTA